jgi:hypothetical protein
MGSMSLNTLVVSLSVLLMVACGVKKEPKSYEDEEQSSGSAGGTIAVTGGSRTSQLVTIPVQMTNRSFGLLASATTYTISLEGCASGYTSTADEGSTALQVYKFDRGCKAKLTTFTFNGKTYIPTAGDGFTTWAANDSATFDEAGEPGTFAVTVKVVSQLADPISGNETVVYQFSELDKGADETLLEADVGAGHALTVASQDPPSFTIFSAALVGINANGGGQFEFVLECTSTIGVTDVCEGVNMNVMTYKLVEDTYGSTLVIGDADALFPLGETAITLPADREAPGGTTTNGGFATVTLDGPDQMANNPNMIFIIQANDMSYQYFNVDVSTLTQN